MRPESKTLLVMGYGEQAESHVAAVRAVMRPERLVIWGRSLDKAKAFAEAQSAHHGIPAAATADPEAAVAEADVICTTTASREPILFGRWLKPGVHLNVVGSSVPTTREIDNDAVAKSRLFVDFADSTRALGGDYRTALTEGAVKEDHIRGEVGAVLSGKTAGRTSPNDITLFKSLGMVSEDLVSARYLLETATAQGVGQWIRM
jgi:ornithine cyclodeaminase